MLNSVVRRVNRLRRLLPALISQRLRLAAGLLCFATLVLPHLLTDPCAPFHNGLCRALDTALQPGHRLIGALPREHAKTTLGTVALVLRELCIGDKRNILLVAANRQEAQVKLRQIVTELETNYLFPPAWHPRLRPARDHKGQLVAYGDAEIVLAGGARVSALGFGGKVRGQLSGGKRLDLVILDDPEDDEMVGSPEQRRKLRQWVDTALLNSLDVERGSLVWLGTLLHHDSVLAQWMQLHAEEAQRGGAAGGKWRVLKLAALSDDGRPLWPARWTRARLEERRREIGDGAFSQEYLNRPLSLAAQVFRAGDFRCYDPAGLRLAAGRWYLDGEPLAVAAGVDPAIGEGDRHDYFAACVVGVARLADAGEPDALRIYVLDVQRVRARFSDQLEALVKLARHWRPRLIGVENVAYQAALSQAALSRGLPVLGVPEVRPKPVRIEAAAVHTARGRVLLPVEAVWTAEFRSEAASYPAGRHDDQLDAFARATEVALSLLPGSLGLEAGGRRPGLVQPGFATGLGSLRGF